MTSFEWPSWLEHVIVTCGSLPAALAITATDIVFLMLPHTWLAALPLSVGPNAALRMFPGGVALVSVGTDGVSFPEDELCASDCYLKAYQKSNCAFNSTYVSTCCGMQRRIILADQSTASRCNALVTQATLQVTSSAVCKLTARNFGTNCRRM